MADKPLKIQGSGRPDRQNEGDGASILPNARIKVLAIAGGVIVLVVAGIFYFNWRSSVNNEQAALELGHVRSYYEQADYDKAIHGDTAKFSGKTVRGLAAIVSDYSSTMAGKAAALELGDAYMAKAQYPEAAKAYQIAAEAGDNTVKAAGLAGVAAVAEAEGKPSEAASHYEEAAAVYASELVAPLYLLGAALNYEKAGQTDKAVERYREIVTRYAESAQTNQARLALARLNIGA